MSEPQAGQTIYAWRWDRIAEYTIEKVTAKTVVAFGPYGIRHRLIRHEGFPSGVVARGTEGMPLWSTRDAALLAEEQRLRQAAAALLDKAAIVLEMREGPAA